MDCARESITEVLIFRSLKGLKDHAVQASKQRDVLMYDVILSNTSTLNANANTPNTVDAINIETHPSDFFKRTQVSEANKKGQTPLPL